MRDVVVCDGASGIGVKNSYNVGIGRKADIIAIHSQILDDYIGSVLDIDCRIAAGMRRDCSGHSDGRIRLSISIQR